MDYPNSITFIRHAESVGNLARATGDESVFEESHNYVFKLTDEGKTQARLLRERMKNQKFDAYYVSAFVRARQTAKLVFPKAKFKIDNRLNEHISGAFHLYPPEKANIVDPYNEEQHDRLGPYFHRGLYGENICDVEIRIQSFLLQMRMDHSRQNICVVTHGHWLLALARIITDAPPEQFEVLKEHASCPNTGVCLYEGVGSTLLARTQNCIKHLGVDGIKVKAST